LLLLLMMMVLLFLFNCCCWTTKNITTQKHSRTQRWHSTNILYNYSMMTSCCKVSEKKQLKSICVWTVGWAVWKPPINYQPIEDITLLYIKALPNIS
jgi:hypothetical protein